MLYSLNPSASALFPRIHVLSDVHLESGPYEVPASLDCDIFVAAGDIGPIDKAVPWLAKLRKPVVYVLGNHEYYGHDISEAVAYAKTLAAGSQVHVLNNEELILQGVRFLGTTLWTDIADMEPTAVWAAHSHMLDYLHIKAASWIAQPGNKERLSELNAKYNLTLKTELLEEAKYKLNPGIIHLLHKDAVAWLKSRIEDNALNLPTVIVSHHVPSYLIMELTGLPKQLCDARGSSRSELYKRFTRNRELTKLVSYASRLEPLLKKASSSLWFWAHGHIHTAHESAIEGCRVLANPRGRHIKPLSSDSAKAYALFGFNVTPDDIAKSQAASAADPFRGDGEGFDPNKVVTIDQGIEFAFEQYLCKHLEHLKGLKSQLFSWIDALPFAKGTPYAAVLRCIDEDCVAFSNVIASIKKDLLSQLGPFDFHWLDGDFEYPGPLPSVPTSFYRKISSQDFLQLKKLLEAWVSWAEGLALLARRRAKAWAITARKCLVFLRSQGIDAEVVAPAWTLGITSISSQLWIKPLIASESASKAILAIDKYLNKSIPRNWVVLEDTLGRVDTVPLHLLNSILGAPEKGELKPSKDKRYP